MDLSKYLAVLVVLCLEGGETGGHGGKHHDHVKIHMPEFIHHDHHTKVITIHHHHHKPKKEHHHHHHHHHKPQIPHGHHYHHHKKAYTTTKTVSKGHGKHGHHGHHGHHSHHGHHGYHGHHGSHGHEHHGNSHGHGHHHDAPPSISYDHNPVPSFEDDFQSSFTPSVPAYGVSGGIAHHTPQVHGITHTVKQVKVYDSLPAVVPGAAGGSHGYEVTEQGEEDDEDAFTAVNSLQQTFPATYGYLRSAAAQPAAHDPFDELTLNTLQSSNHDPFGAAPQPTSALSGETFTGAIQSDPFASLTPDQNDIPSVQPSPDYPVSFQADDGFDKQATAFAGTGQDGTAYISSDEGSLVDESPVTFSREAGIQQTTKTGGVETVIY